MLNKENCQEVMERKEEEEEKAEFEKEVSEVKRLSAGGLYPDLSLLTDS